MGTSWVSILETRVGSYQEKGMQNVTGTCY